MKRKIAALAIGSMIALIPVAPALAVAPTVLSVSSTTPNGSYKADAGILIQVTFSENVTVTGAPILTLETGTTDRNAFFFDVSGTTIRFTYTVNSGDTSSDLDYIATTSLALNGGTIKNAGLENATLTLPAPGTTNSLGVNKAIVIDTTAPTASATTATIANSANAVAQSNEVGTAYLVSTTVTVTDEASITDASPPLRSSVTPITAANTNTNISASGLGNGTFKVYTVDAAKNVSAASTDIVTIDSTTPAVVGVSSSTPNGSYKAAATVSIQVVFTSVVNVTGTPTLTLETGTTDQVVNYTSGSGSNTLTFVYAVQAGDTTTDLDYAATNSLALNSGTIRNSALTNATLTLATPGQPNSLGAFKAIVIDTTAPTLISSSPADEATSVGVDANIILNFLEPVTAVATRTITIVKIVSSTTTTLETITLPDSRVTISGSTVTVNPTLNLENSTAYHVLIGAGAFTDLATNDYAGISTATVLNFTTGNVAVAASVSSVTSSKANGSYKAGETISIQVLFNGSVTVTGTPTLSVATGGGGTAVNYASGTGTGTLTFTYTVQAADTSPDLDIAGTNALALNGGTITGGVTPAVLTLPTPGTPSSLAGSKAIVIDNFAPSLAGSNPADDGIGVVLAANLILAFTEPVVAVVSKNIHIVPTINTKTITTAALATNVVTLTTSAAHGYSANNFVTISGMTNAVFNGAYLIASVLSSTTFTYARTNADIASGAASGTAIMTNAKTITTAALTSNVVTLTTSATHGYLVNDYVSIVEMANTVFNGVYIIASVTGTTFTFAKTNADIASGAASGTATKTHATIAANGGQVSVSNNQVTINQTTDFPVIDVEHYLLIDAGAFTDVAGNPYSGISSTTALSFTTGVDSIAPLLVASDPPNNMTTFSIDRNITLTFNEAVTAVTAKSIVIRRTADNSIFETIAADGARVTVSGNTVTINPTNNLANATAYYVLIDVGAFTDASSNNYAGIASTTVLIFSTPAGFVAPSDGGFVPVSGFVPVPGLFVPVPGVFFPVPGAFIPGIGQPGYFPPSYGPPPSFGNTGRIDGGSLTGGNIGALPPSTFNNFNPNQLGAISNGAFAQFNPDQLGALPPSAMAGFRPDQLGALPPSAMAGFSQNQFAALPPSAMTGFSSLQFGAVPPEAMSAMNSTQMKSLTSSAMAGFNQNQFAALPASAMSGFKPAQFGAVPPSALAGFSQNQFAALPASAMGAFTTTQMDSMPASALSAMTPNQFKAMTPELLASMSSEQRNALPQQAFNTGQLTAPINGRNNAQLVGALTGWNIDQVPASTFNNFKPTEVAKLSNEAFSALSPDQFKAMPANAFSGFKPDQVGSLPPEVFAGMKPSQFAAMPSNAFGSFNAEQVSAMPAGVFAAMKPNQMSQMSPESMANISPQQMGAMPANAFAGFKPDQVGAMPPSAFAGMKPSQMGAMPAAAFGSFSPEQLGAMPATAFAAMKPSQMGQMSPESMANISPQQMGAMPANAFAGFKPDQVGAMPASAFAGMKPSQMGAMPAAAFGSFSPEQMGAMPAAAFAAMKPNQMGQLPSAAFESMKPTQFAAMPSTAFTAIKADQVDALPAEAFAGMKPTQVASLTPVAVGSLSVDQVSALPAVAFTAMKPSQLGALQAEAMAEMSSQQLGALPAAALKAMKADQVDALPAEAFAGMKPTQVASLTPVAVGSLSADQVGALPAGAFTAMKPNQVASLTPESVGALDPAQARALPPVAVASLKPAQIGEMSPEAVGAMKPAQMAALKPSSASGFTTEQLTAMTPAQERALTPAFVNQLTPEQKAALANG